METLVNITVHILLKKNLYKYYCSSYFKKEKINIINVKRLFFKSKDMCNCTMYNVHVLVLIFTRKDLHISKDLLVKSFILLACTVHVQLFKRKYLSTVISVNTC